MIGFERTSLSLFLFASLAVAPACGDDGGSAAGDGSTSAAEGSTGGGPTTAAPTSTSTTSTPEPSTGQADETGIIDTNDTAPQGECVLWDPNDCGEGSKCMPYSIEDDGIPDEVQCCPAVEEPALNGEPCMADEYNGSCIDNCEPGSMCVLDDEDSLTGLCRQFCDPSGNDCDPDQTCKAFFELLPGVPNLPTCMDRCDPLLQDCSPDGWHCIPDSPTEAGQSGFLCTPPPSGPPVGIFEPCALANQCEPGLVCVTDDRVPGCTFASCCTAYCDLADGDSACQDIDPQLECTDWMSPDPEWQDVGACTLPQQ
ncbi:MAG: hypothetical protein AAGA54_03130 [Myxococcota bacterium]